MILFSIFSWYRPVKRTIACHWELSSTAKKKKGLSTWPSMNWLPLPFKYCRSFRVLINFINFRPHSNYFYQIIIITFIYTIQLLPIAVMPKNDRDLILWHLLKFLCVKAKRKNFTFWRQQFGYLVLRFKFCCCFCSLLGRKRLFLRLFLTLLSTRRSKFQKSRSPTLKWLFLTAKEAWNWR